MELKNADNLHNFKQVQSVSEDVRKPGRFGFSVNSNVMLFKDFKKLLHGIRKRR